MSLIKKTAFFLVSLLIGAALLFWVIESVGWIEIKKAFLTFEGWQALVIIGLTLTIPIIGTWRWREVLEGEGIDLQFKKLFRLYLAGFPFMFFFPMILMSGEVFRGYALRKKLSVSWPKSMASIVLDRLLDWTVGLGVVFIGVVFFLFKIGFPPRRISLIFGGTFLILGAALFFFYLKSFRKESILKLFGISNGRAIEVENNIFHLFKSKTLILRIFSLSLIIGLIKLLRIWLLVIFLGEIISFIAAVSFLGFFYLAIMLPIPASLGSHELIQTFAFKSLGLEAGTAPAFTMILRGADLILALVGGVALIKLGWELMKSTLLEKISGD